MRDGPLITELLANRNAIVSTIFALLCTESPRRPVTYAGKPYHVATGPRARKRRSRR